MYEEIEMPRRIIAGSRGADAPYSGFMTFWNVARQGGELVPFEDRFVGGVAEYALVDIDPRRAHWSHPFSGWANVIFNGARFTAREWLPMVAARATFKEAPSLMDTMMTEGEFFTWLESLDGVEQMT